MSVRKELKARKLLVASVGLATASYVGCNGVTTGGFGGSGNLLPPPDAGTDLKSEVPPPFPPSGNLMPPPIPYDAGAKDVGDADAADGAGDATDGAPDTLDTAPELPPMGNLLPPPPVDAAPDGAVGVATSRTKHLA
jgi:hypothetical protein